MKNRVYDNTSDEFKYSGSQKSRADRLLQKLKYLNIKVQPALLQ